MIRNRHFVNFEFTRSKTGCDRGFVIQEYPGSRRGGHFLILEISLHLDGYGFVCSLTVVLYTCTPYVFCIPDSVLSYLN